MPAVHIVAFCIPVVAYGIFGPPFSTAAVVLLLISLQSLERQRAKSVLNRDRHGCAREHVRRHSAKCFQSQMEHKRNGLFDDRCKSKLSSFRGQPGDGEGRKMDAGHSAALSGCCRSGAGSSLKITSSHLRCTRLQVQCSSPQYRTLFELETALVVCQVAVYPSTAL